MWEKTESERKDESQEIRQRREEVVCRPTMRRYETLESVYWCSCIDVRNWSSNTQSWISKGILNYNLQYIYSASDFPRHFLLKFSILDSKKALLLWQSSSFNWLWKISSTRAFYFYCLLEKALEWKATLLYKANESRKNFRNVSRLWDILIKLAWSY